MVQVETGAGQVGTGRDRCGTGRYRLRQVWYRSRQVWDKLGQVETDQDCRDGVSPSCFSTTKPQRHKEII
jgi:hypothetical protein